MANSESTIGIEHPKEIKSDEVAKTIQQPPPPKEKRKRPKKTLLQDIKNHPLVWVATSFVNTVILILVNVSCFHIESEFFNKKAWAQFYAFLVDLAIFGALALLSASWASRWGDENQKGEEAVIPPFKIRFWRSLRLLLIAFVFPALWVIPQAFNVKQIDYIFNTVFPEGMSGIVLFAAVPVIVSLVAYSAILAYVNWWQGGIKTKKPSIRRSQS